MRLLALAVVAAVCARCGDGAPAATEPPPARPVALRPNVLLVVIDTLRADRCSCLGYSRSTTPALDRLGAEGTVYEQAWSPSSWTVPAHAGLFTGLGPARLGLAEGRVRALPPEAPTVAETLCRAGWRTGCFSANAWISSATGLTRGFASHDPLHLVAGGPSATRVFESALHWIRRARTDAAPWFAFVNVLEPHMPYAPPAEWQARFLRPGIPAAAVEMARTLQAPACAALDARRAFGDDVVDAARDLYDAEVACADDALGRFVGSLRELGALDDTWILVTSDHGEGLADHGWLGHANWLHPELLRVPLVIRPPGGAAPARVTDVVRLEDVAATILGIAGSDPPQGAAGRTLLGPVAGRASVAMHGVPASLHAQIDALPLGGDPAPLKTSRRSLRRGEWLLETDALGGTTLFDIGRDALGARDVSADHPDVTARLRAELDAATRR